MYSAPKELFASESADVLELHDKVEVLVLESSSNSTVSSLVAPVSPGALISNNNQMENAPQYQVTVVPDGHTNAFLVRRVPEVNNGNNDYRSPTLFQSSRHSGRNLVLSSNESNCRKARSDYDIQHDGHGRKYLLADSFLEDLRQTKSTSGKFENVNQSNPLLMFLRKFDDNRKCADTKSTCSHRSNASMTLKNNIIPIIPVKSANHPSSSGNRQPCFVRKYLRKSKLMLQDHANVMPGFAQLASLRCLPNGNRKPFSFKSNFNRIKHRSYNRQCSGYDSDCNDPDPPENESNEQNANQSCHQDCPYSNQRENNYDDSTAQPPPPPPPEENLDYSCPCHGEYQPQLEYEEECQCYDHQAYNDMVQPDHNDHYLEDTCQSPYQSRIASRNQSVHNQPSSPAAAINYNYCTVETCRSPRQSRAASRNQSIHSQQTSPVVPIQYNYCTAETCQNCVENRAPSRNQSIHSQPQTPAAQNQYENCTAETCQNQSRHSRVPSRNQSIHSQPPMPAAQNQYDNCTAVTCLNQSRHSRVPSRNQSIHSQPPMPAARNQYDNCTAVTCQNQSRHSRVPSKNHSIHSQPPTLNVAHGQCLPCTRETCESQRQSRVESRNQSMHSQSPTPATQNQYDNCSAVTCQNQSRHSRVPSRNQSIHSQPPILNQPCLPCTRETCESQRQSRVGSRNQSMHNHSSKQLSVDIPRDPDVPPDEFNDDRNSQTLKTPRRSTTSKVYAPPILQVQDCDCNYYAERDQNDDNRDPYNKTDYQDDQSVKSPQKNTTQEINKTYYVQSNEYDDIQEPCNRKTCIAQEVANYQVDQTVKSPQKNTTQEINNTNYVQSDEYDDIQEPCNRKTCITQEVANYQVDQTVKSPQKNKTQEISNTNYVQSDEYDDIQEPCNRKTCITQEVTNYQVDQREVSRQRNTTQACNCATYLQSDKYEDIQEPCNKKTCITQGVAHHHVDRTLQGRTPACNCGNYVQSDEYDEINESCNRATCNTNKYQAEESEQYDDIRETCNRNTCNQPVRQTAKNPRRSTSSKSSAQRVGPTQDYEYVESDQYEKHDPCNRNTCNTSRYQAVSNQQTITQHRSKSCHRLSQQQSIQASSCYKDGRACSQYQSNLTVSQLKSMDTNSNCRRSTCMEDNQGNDTQLNTTQKKKSGHETCNKRSCIFKSSKGKLSQNQQSEPKSCRKNNCIFRSKRSRAQKQNNNPSYAANQNFSVGCVSTMNQPMNQPMSQPMNQPMNQNQQLGQSCNQDRGNFGTCSNNRMSQDNQNNYNFYCKNEPEDMQPQDLQICNNSNLANKYDCQMAKGEKGTKCNKKCISASQALTNKISDRFNKVRNRFLKRNKSKKQAEVICESDCRIVEQNNTATTCCKDPDTIVCVSNDENKDMRSTVISECANYDKNKDLRSNEIRDCPFIECEEKLSEKKCICSDSDDFDDEQKLKANKQYCKWREAKLMNDKSNLMECECSEEELDTECICSNSETPDERKNKNDIKNKKEIATSSERKRTKQKINRIECECSSSNYVLQQKLKGSKKSKYPDYKSKETRSNKFSKNLKECVCSEEELEERECACSDTDSLDQANINTKRKLKGNTKSDKRISKSEERKLNNASKKLNECVCSEEEIVEKACVCSDTDSQDHRENNIETKLQGKEKSISKPKETRSNNVSRKLKECVCSEEEIMESKCVCSNSESQDQRDVVRKRRASKSKEISSKNEFRKLKETESSEDELVERQCVCSDTELQDHKDMGRNKRVSKSKESKSNNVSRKFKETESSEEELVERQCVCSDTESLGHKDMGRKKRVSKSKETKSNNVSRKFKETESSEDELVERQCVCSDTESQDHKDMGRNKRVSKSKETRSNNVSRKLKETESSEEELVESKCVCSDTDSQDQKDMGRKKHVSKSKETKSKNVFRKLKQTESSEEELVERTCVCSDTESQDPKDMGRNKRVSKSKETKSNNVFRKLKETESSEQELVERNCVCSDKDSQDHKENNTQSKLQGKDFCDKKSSKRISKSKETRSSNVFRKLKEVDSSGGELLKSKCVCSDADSQDDRENITQSKLKGKDFCDKKSSKRISKSKETRSNNVFQKLKEDDSSGGELLKSKCVCSDTKTQDQRDMVMKKRVSDATGKKSNNVFRKLKEDESSEEELVENECICSDAETVDQTDSNTENKLKGEDFCNKKKNIRVCNWKDTKGKSDSQNLKEEEDFKVKSTKEECIYSDLEPNHSETGDDNKRNLKEINCDKTKNTREDLKQDPNCICKQRSTPKSGNESDISERKSSNYKTTTSQEANYICEDPSKENVNGVLKGSDFCNDAIKRSSKSGEYCPLPKNDRSKLDSCICSDFSRRSSKTDVFDRTIKRSSKSGEYCPVPKNDRSKLDSCICSDFSRRSSKTDVYKATRDEICDFKKQRSPKDRICEVTSLEKQSSSDDSLNQTPRVLKGKDFCEKHSFTIVDKVIKEKQKEDYAKGNCKYTGKDLESEQSDHKLKGRAFCTENMYTNDNSGKCKSLKNENVQDNTDEFNLKCKQTNDQSEKCGCVHDVEQTEEKFQYNTGKIHKETTPYNSDCDDPCDNNLENVISHNDPIKKSNIFECEDINSRKSNAQKKSNADLDRSTDEKLLESEYCEKKVDKSKCYDSPSMEVDISSKPKGNIVGREYQIEETDSLRCEDSQSKLKQNTFNEDNFECLEEKSETDGWLRASDFCDNESECRRSLDLQSKPKVSRKDEESCKCHKQDTKSENKLKDSDFYNGISNARYEVGSCICSDLTIQSERMTKDNYSYSGSKGKLKSIEFCECESNGRQKKRTSKTKQRPSDDDFCKCGTSAATKFGEFFSCDSDDVNDSDVCKCYDLPIKSESNRSQKNKNSVDKSDRSIKIDDVCQCKTPSKSKESDLCECYLPLKKKSSLKTQRKSCTCDDDPAGQKSAKGQKIVIVCEEKHRRNSNSDKSCVRKLSRTRHNSTSSSSSCCSCTPNNSEAQNAKRSSSSTGSGRGHDGKQKKKRKLSTDDDDTSQDESHCRPRAKSGSCNNEFREPRSGEIFGRPPAYDIYSQRELPMQRMEEANHLQRSISQCNEIRSQRHADNQLPKVKIECRIVNCGSTPNNPRTTDSCKLGMNSSTPISGEQACKLSCNNNQGLPLTNNYNSNTDDVRFKSSICYRNNNAQKSLSKGVNSNVNFEVPTSRCQLKDSEHFVSPVSRTLNSGTSRYIKPRTQSSYNDICSNNRRSQRNKDIKSRKKDNSFVFHCSIGNLSIVQAANDEDHNNRSNHRCHNMRKKGNHEHDSTCIGQTNSRTRTSERNCDKKCCSNGRLNKTSTSESSSNNDDECFERLNNNRPCNTTRSNKSKTCFRKQNSNSKRNKRDCSRYVSSIETISSCESDQEDSSEDSDSKSRAPSYCDPQECFRSKTASYDTDDRFSRDTNNVCDKGKMSPRCNDQKNDEYSNDYSGSSGSCDESCYSSGTSDASSSDNRDFEGQTIHGRRNMVKNKYPGKCDKKTKKSKSRPEYPTEYKPTPPVTKESCRSLGGYCNNRRRRRARNARASRSVSANEIIELLTPVSANREVAVIYVNTNWVNNTSGHSISEHFEPSCTNKVDNKNDMPGPSSPN